uniref:Uncharacterized protein n=1 Tax=Cacopsylla melanoneura TaxID=428564 RepID=A0A8D8SQ73_9HEMI
MHIKCNPDQYHSFSEVHTYNTRQKNNLMTPAHRVNSARNGPNYFAIKLFNKIPHGIRDLPPKSFKILLTLEFSFYPDLSGLINFIYCLYSHVPIVIIMF